MKLSFPYIFMYSAITPQLTLMQPTIVVVNAELYCVQSTVEYMRTNLQKQHITIRFHNVSATGKTKGDCELQAMA